MDPDGPVVGEQLTQVDEAVPHHCQPDGVFEKASLSKLHRIAFSEGSLVRSKCLSRFPLPVI